VSYTLTNTGGTTLSWSIASAGNASWISISASAGQLEPAGGSTVLTVAFNSAANAQLAGHYTETLTFNADGVAISLRQVSLNVLDTVGEIEVSPSDSQLVSGTEGGTFTPSVVVYTITNIGGEAVAWSAEVAADDTWLTLSSTMGTL